MVRFVMTNRFPFVFGVVLFDPDRLPRQALDLSQLIPFVPTAERGGDSRRAGSAGAANAVNVNLGNFR